jgi:hypothetical protein
VWKEHVGIVKNMGDGTEGESLKAPMKAKERQQCIQISLGSEIVAKALVW